MKIKDIEFILEILVDYTKDFVKAETYREKADVQFKHAKLILNKVNIIKETDIEKIFNTITANGCREMDIERFQQAVNEILQIHYNKLSLKLISISCYAFERYNHKEYEIVQEIVNDIKKWCKK